MKEIPWKKLTAEGFAKYGSYANMINPSAPHLGAEPIQFRLDLVDLARAGIGGGVGALAPAADHLHDLGAGALHQASGFLGAALPRCGASDVEGYENRAGALRRLGNAQAGR